jgi:uncharacterized membrane protein YcgQ (UPF0703/DUF1980 family)
MEKSFGSSSQGIFHYKKIPMKNMMKYLFLAAIISLTGCADHTNDGTTTVKVQEVEQVGSYTYMLVKGKGPAYWVAATSMEISPGESITYQSGLLMEDFYSKDLDRTFDKVLFLDAVMGSSKTNIRKSDVEVSHEEGIVPISELYKNPDSYKGKKIQVKGEVSKVNEAIMNRNWIHIQDGTVFEGKFDLTVTSQETFEVGQVVTLEGILSVDMDFGYGYSYEILLEEATVAR